MQIPKTVTVCAETAGRPRAGRTARRFGAPLTPRLARRPLCGEPLLPPTFRRRVAGVPPVRRGALRWTYDVEILEEYDDFSQDDFWLDRIFAARPAGHVCIFAPKCHPELQGAIEMAWARIKFYCARHSNHTLDGLQKAIPGAFSEANISLDLVQKWFRKSRDYMTVYKQGATGQSADKAQKGVK